MIKKFLLITTLSITFNAYSEPSDFVARELIQKPVTYMTLGIQHCNNSFAEKSITNDKFPTVNCEYDWEQNRLFFRQFTTIDGIGKDDYSKAYAYCKENIHPLVEQWFVSDLDALIKFKHLSGFSPRGYEYKDREKELNDFFARSKASIKIYSSSFSNDNQWYCEWKVGDKSPSLKFTAEPEPF